MTPEWRTGVRPRAPSFRHALLIYLGLVAALTVPFWWQGQVVAPFRQTSEIAADERPGSAPLENRRFSDYLFQYLPETIAAFDRSQSGWLAVWTDRNELGRPIDHLWGLSPVYLPSWFLFAVSDGPPRFATLLSLGLCVLAGLFVMLWCKEKGLSPLAGLLAGASLAGSPTLIYWLTFPTFNATYCWAAGALYAVTRLHRRPDLVGWSVLAFSIYSLLVTGYQQLVVFHAYLLGGVGIWLLYRRWQSSGPGATARAAAVMVSAVVLGTALASPPYLDLVHAAAESARLAPDPSFFVANFPPLATLDDVARFAVLSTFPEVLGQPVSPAFPFVYNGRSSTVLMLFCAIVALLLRRRDTWGWWLPIGVSLVLLFVKPLYLFGVEHLGFNLSRAHPFAAIVLPVTILAAYGADALVRRGDAAGHFRAVVAAGAATGAALCAAVAFGLVHGLGVRWNVVAITLATLGALCAQYVRLRPALLVAALVAVGGSVSFPLMLRQDPSAIATTSPLVTLVHDNLPDGSRFAIVAPGLPVLPANLNAAVGLASIHTYNSLSSRRYQGLIRSLGGEMRVYGRSNDWIAPDYDSSAFWMSNIAVILSPSRLTARNLEYVGQRGPAHVHRVISRMGCCVQVPLGPDGPSPGIRIDDPRPTAIGQPTLTAHRGDALEIQVTFSEPSVLVLSQVYHRGWRAHVLTDTGWAAAATLPVNDVFQGVQLPRGARTVRLRFEPYVRWAWSAHAFWIVLALTLLVLQLRKRLAMGSQRLVALSCGED